MKPKIICILKLFGAIALFFSSMAAQAMPKAAEHADAPVTKGADIARPKPSAKPAKPPVAKSKPDVKIKSKEISKSPQKKRSVSGKK